MKNKKPFFSVIVPCYNVKLYLKECIESIIGQSFKDFELFIIDDGSTDGCSEICDKYKEKDNRIRVFHQANAGVSVARNKGIKNANAEWIIFIDPDDWVEKGMLEALHEIVSETKADLYLFDYYQEFAKKRVIKQFMSQSGYLPQETIKELRLAPFNQFIKNGKIEEYETNVIWDKVYKTDILRSNKLHFIEEARKGQDVIFNAEAFQLCNSYYYFHKTLYHYRYLESSITNRYNPNVRFYNEIAFREQERIINQYKLQEEYWDNYYVRVLTRLYSCMRLYYFHEKNPKSWLQTKKELRQVLKTEPYKNAMNRVKQQFLHGGQKIFVLCLKSRCFLFLKILVRARIKIQQIKGKKLK